MTTRKIAGVERRKALVIDGMASGGEEQNHHPKHLICFPRDERIEVVDEAVIGAEMVVEDKITEEEVEMVLATMRCLSMITRTCETDDRCETDDSRCETNDRCETDDRSVDEAKQTLLTVR